MGYVGYLAGARSCSSTLQHFRSNFAVVLKAAPALPSTDGRLEQSRAFFVLAFVPPAVRAGALGTLFALLRLPCLTASARRCIRCCCPSMAASSGHLSSDRAHLRACCRYGRVDRDGHPTHDEGRRRRHCRPPSQVGYASRPVGFHNGPTSDSSFGRPCRRGRLQQDPQPGLSRGTARPRGALQRARCACGRRGRRFR